MKMNALQEVDPIVIQFLKWIDIDECEHGFVLSGATSIDDLFTLFVNGGHYFVSRDGCDHTAVIRGVASVVARESRNQGYLPFDIILSLLMEVYEDGHGLGSINMRQEPALSCSEHINTTFDLDPVNIHCQQLTELISHLEDTNWSYNANTKTVELSLMSGKYVSIAVSAFLQLYIHQREGIEWILRRYDSQIGGILADEMGMGKTRQVLVAVLALFQEKIIKRVLILCPPMLIANWEEELGKLLSLFQIPTLWSCILKSGLGQNCRNKSLIKARNEAKNCGCPLLVVSSDSFIKLHKGDNPESNALYPSNEDQNWDWIVIDEAHRAKNPSTLLSRALKRKDLCKSNGTFRLMLSATPIQNKLEEFFNLVDWTTSSKVLGKERDFNNYFKEHIEKGLQVTASCQEKETSSERCLELQSKLEPYVLKRAIQEELRNVLPEKKEYAVLIGMDKKHRMAIKQDLASEWAERAKQSSNTRVVLGLITRYRLSCLDSFFTKSRSGEQQHLSRVRVDDHNHDDPFPFRSPSSHTVQDYLSRNSFIKIMKHSTKLAVCCHLVGQFIQEGLKTIIFSPWVRHFDLLEHVLKGCGIGCYRVDGGTNEDLRKQYFQEFNTDKSRFSVMLVSIKVGGLGLNLIGASRVILLSPVWNPTVDAQAVGRTFRIGQSNQIQVYRLIMAGTIEEKMYWKHLQKDGRNRYIEQELQDSILRCFNKEELHRLLKLQSTCESLQRFSGAVVSKEVQEFDFVTKHEAVLGLLRHDDLCKPSPSAFRTGGDPKVGIRHQPFLPRDYIIQKDVKGCRNSGHPRASVHDKYTPPFSIVQVTFPDGDTGVNVKEAFVVRKLEKSSPLIGKVFLEDRLLKVEKLDVKHWFVEDLNDHLNSASNNRRLLEIYRPPCRTEGSDENYNERQPETNPTRSPSPTSIRLIVAPKGTLGITIEKGFVITKIRRSSPLFGKIFSGDWLMKIDQKTIEGWELADVQNHLKAGAGTNKNRVLEVYRPYHRIRPPEPTRTTAIEGKNKRRLQVHTFPATNKRRKTITAIDKTATASTNDRKRTIQSLYNDITQSSDKLFIIKRQEAGYNYFNWNIVQVDLDKTDHQRAKRVGIYRCKYYVRHYAQSRKQLTKNCQYWPLIKEFNRDGTFGPMVIVPPSRVKSALDKNPSTRGWYQLDENLAEDGIVGPFNFSKIEGKFYRIDSSVWEELKDSVESECINVDTYDIDMINALK